MSWKDSDHIWLYTKEAFCYIQRGNEPLGGCRNSQNIFFIFQTFLFSCMPGNHGYAKDILKYYKLSSCGIREYIYEYKSCTV